MSFTTSKGTTASWFRLMAMELGVLIFLTGCLSDPATVAGPGGIGSKQVNGEYVEIEGYIESISGSTLVVFETTVLVNELTRIGGEHGDEITVDDLIVGMWVELEGTLVDGVVIATRIEVDSRDESRTTT